MDGLAPGLRPGSIHEAPIGLIKKAKHCVVDGLAPGLRPGSISEAPIGLMKKTNTEPVCPRLSEKRIASEVGDTQVTSPDANPTYA